MEDVNTVSIEEYQRVCNDLEALRSLVKGEWVDTERICTALGITFGEGMKMFDFGRMVAWNKAPKNGQYVVTKFRIAEKTVQPPKVFWCEEDDIGYAKVNAEPNMDTHQWELILEQQGGII